MVHNQVSGLVSSLVSQEKHDEISEKVNDFLGMNLLSQAEIDENIESISEYAAQKASDTLNDLRKNFSNDEEFFEFERRIMLQSIDELWMLHIDAMSKLRESVAFE